MAQGHHHPAGGVIGPAWLLFPLLEERQLLAEEEVLRGEAVLGAHLQQGEPTKIE